MLEKVGAERKAPLTLVGPAPLWPFIQGVMETTELRLPFPIEFIEVTRLEEADVLPDLLVRATPALDVLLQRTYVRGWGVRHVIARRASTMGLLPDQVQVAAACLAAQDLTGEPRYVDIVTDLAAVMDRAYADSLGGYYDVTDAAPNSGPMPEEGTGDGRRTKHVFDDVLPGPNAQAALVLAELAMVTRDPAAGASYRRRARKTLEAFAGAMLNPVEPIGTATFLAAAQKTLQRR